MGHGATSDPWKLAPKDGWTRKADGRRPSMAGRRAPLRKRGRGRPGPGRTRESAWFPGSARGQTTRVERARVGLPVDPWTYIEGRIHPAEDGNRAGASPPSTNPSMHVLRLKRYRDRKENEKDRTDHTKDPEGGAKGCPSNVARRDGRFLETVTTEERIHERGSAHKRTAGVEGRQRREKDASGPPLVRHRNGQRYGDLCHPRFQPTTTRKGHVSHQNHNGPSNVVRLRHTSVRARILLAIVSRTSEGQSNRLFQPAESLPRNDGEGFDPNMDKHW